MPRRRLRLLTLLAALLCLLPSAGRTALHLMFPYDYLSLTQAERRHYVIGVLDARLAPFRATPRLQWLTRCLTEHGVNRIQSVLETEIIPAPDTATIPMPYLVERTLGTVCDSPASTSQ